LLPLQKSLLKSLYTRGEPNENVVVWLRQVKNIFHAQGIKNKGSIIHYVTTGLDDAALYWFVNKVKDTTEPAFANWVGFSKALKDAFQPPNYQHFLRIQLKTLRQTYTVQEYGIRFRNIIEQIDTINELNKVSYFINGFKGATCKEVVYQAPETFEEAWKLAICFNTTMFGLGKPKMEQQKNRTSLGERYQSLSRKGYYNHSTPMELDYAGSSQENHKGNYKKQLP